MAINLRLFGNNWRHGSISQSLRLYAGTVNRSFTPLIPTSGRTVDATSNAAAMCVIRTSTRSGIVREFLNGVDHEGCARIETRLLRSMAKKSWEHCGVIAAHAQLLNPAKFARLPPYSWTWLLQRLCCNFLCALSSFRCCAEDDRWLAAFLRSRAHAKRLEFLQHLIPETGSLPAAS